MDYLGFGLGGPEANVRRKRDDELVSECNAKATLELDDVAVEFGRNGGWPF